MTSDFGGSQARHERSYMLFKRVGPSGGSPVLLAYWNALAQAVRLSGDYTEACDLGEDALAYGRDQLGVEDPRTLRTQVDLAIARRLSGEVEEALDLGQDAHSPLPCVCTVSTTPAPWPRRCAWPTCGG